MQEVAVYVHIPFCASKCLYCDFASNAVNASKVSQEAYIEALLKEIDLYEMTLQDVVIKSVFFGGGTPSVLEATAIERLLSRLKRYAEIKPSAEITLEGNPESLTPLKLSAYKAMGINRLSIGLQATDDDVLKTIGRVHDYATFKRAYSAARAAGFENINVDLMFGLPGQTALQFQKTLETVIDLEPEHIASYSLKVEEGTPLFDMEKAGTFTAMDDAAERALYHQMIEVLGKNGYAQYEISNFAKSGFASEHNLTYWHNAPYLGFGASAHAKFSDCRYANFRDAEIYVSEIEKGEKPICENQFIDREEELFETIMLTLRLNEGLDFQAYNKRYGVDFMAAHSKTVERLEKQGLVSVTEERLKLTALGRDLSNQVFVAFL